MSNIGWLLSAVNNPCSRCIVFIIIIISADSNTNNWTISPPFLLWSPLWTFGCLLNGLLVCLLVDLDLVDECLAAVASQALVLHSSWVAVVLAGIGRAGGGGGGGTDLVGRGGCGVLRDLGGVQGGAWVGTRWRLGWSGGLAETLGGLWYLVACTRLFSL